MAKGKKTKDEAAQDRIDKEQRQADAPAVEDEAEAQAETARDQAGHEKHIDSTREAIMKKSTSDRLHRKQKDTEQLDDDGKRLQEAMEAEVRGEPNEFDTEYDADAEAAAEDEPAPPKTPETVDSDPDLVTITVDGVEKTVSRSEVEKAGIAAMQKLSAADQRMRDASTYEASLKTLEASLRKQMEDIQNQLPTGDGKPAGDGDANLPDEGAVAAAVAEQAAKVAGAIYSGDEDQVKEGLIAALTSVAQGRQSSTPPLDAKQFAQDVMVNMRREAKEAEEARQAEERRNVAKTVNSTFETEFPELFADDRGFRLTKTDFELRCEENPTADRVELMRQAATAISKVVNPPVTDVLKERQRRKRAADADTPSNAQRAPTDKPAAKKTRKDIVAEMQRNRGQLTS